jgi:hypothetical protein
MIKKLAKHSDGWALVLDQSELESLHIDPETPLQVLAEGDEIVISRAQSPERIKAFEDALEYTNVHYAEALKRLAE